MHDSARRPDFFPDDAFIVWWKGSWNFLFSQSTKQIYIESRDYRPVPLSLERDDVLYLLDVIENWTDERQEEANRLLAQGADLGVKLELEMARKKSRSIFKNSTVKFYVPGQPGYEDAKKAMEEQEKKRREER